MPFFEPFAKTTKKKTKKKNTCGISNVIAITSNRFSYRALRSAYLRNSTQKNQFHFINCKLQNHTLDESESFVKFKKLPIIVLSRKAQVLHVFEIVDWSNEALNNIGMNDIDGSKYIPITNLDSLKFFNEPFGGPSTSLLRLSRRIVLMTD